MRSLLIIIVLLSAIVGCRKDKLESHRLETKSREFYNKNVALSDSLKIEWGKHDTISVQMRFNELFNSNYNDTLFFDLLINYKDATGFSFGIFDLSHDNSNSEWKRYSFQQRSVIRYNISLVYQLFAKSELLFSSKSSILGEELESKIWTIDSIISPAVVNSALASGNLL